MAYMFNKRVFQMQSYQHLPHHMNHTNLDVNKVNTLRDGVLQFLELVPT
jgi:hypothetical protein